MDDARPRPGRAPPAPLPTPTTPRFDRGARLVPRALGALSEAPTRASVARRERSYRLLLATADGFAALVALYVAVVVIGDDRLRPGAVLVVPIVIVASKLMGLYDRDELVLKKTTLEESAPLFQLATVFALITWLLDGVLIDGLPRQPPGPRAAGACCSDVAPRPHPRPRDRAPARAGRALPGGRQPRRHAPRDPRPAGDAPREGGRHRAHAARRLRAPASSRDGRPRAGDRQRRRPPRDPRPGAHRQRRDPRHDQPRQEPRRARERAAAHLRGRRLGGRVRHTSTASRCSASGASGSSGPRAPSSGRWISPAPCWPWWPSRR